MQSPELGGEEEKVSPQFHEDPRCKSGNIAPRFRGSVA